ncbi:hypothetical protein Y032_0221g2589 [Ancylostoma ceylanicum]|uniref:Uncharacterized protein n=1 Tax=Ancylostoma ceylanicum TaxID=53326 RepID=A0A016SJA4_9BILA|nr:hypothetical protein Y032_0221g2589 [Ancylostoma ceylanicum]
MDGVSRFPALQPPLHLREYNAMDRNSISTEATAAEEVKEIAACSSMDPITRDVERRMSMKRESSHAEEAMSEDIRSEQFSSSRSSMDLAKTWARSYGTFASSLFREAFHRMKTVADRYMNSVFSATKGSCHDFVQVTKRPIADCNRWASSLFPCV